MYDLNLAKSNFSNYRNQDFRTHQAEAIKYVLESEKKIVVLEAATGSGKSLIGMVTGSATGNLSYLVHTKILQNQITQDFPESSSLFGRANYICKMSSDHTCDECSHTLMMPCRHKRTDCEYESRKKEVLAAKYKIMNYDYYLSECNYVEKFSGAPLVVIDEADSLENVLINFTTLQFSSYALRRMDMLDWAGKLKMTSKDKVGLLESWKEFGAMANERVNNVIKKLSRDIESWGQDLNLQQMEVLKEKSRVVRLKEKINLFLDNVDENWLLDNQDGSKLIFRPLWMTQELAENFLWRHGQKFVLMSASFYPKLILAKCLGIDVDDMDYHEVLSQFPVSNRPVYCCPVANMTAKTTEAELPKLISAVKTIVDAYPDVKGIIHAVSYKLAESIISGVNNPRLITHNSHDRQEVIDNFIESSEPLILVSPSLERGISLDEDKCRLIIILKAPFLSLGDKIISSRLYSSHIGQQWYTATMLLTILQMCGRGIRSKDDKADTFILDTQAKKAIQSYPSFLPSWWLEALEFQMPTKIGEISYQPDSSKEQVTNSGDDVPF